MPRQPKRPPLDPCPVEAAVAVFGGKWKARILLELAAGPLTFGALRRALPGISQQVLSTQLAALAADGIVDRSPAGSRPQDGSRYALSAEGRSLLPALDGLATWGLDRLDRRGLAWVVPIRPPLRQGRPRGVTAGRTAP